MKIEKRFWRVLILFLVLTTTANYIGFKRAQRQARDRQRILDIGAIELGLAGYKNKYGYYPPSQDGKMLACYQKVDESVAQKIKTEKIVGIERLMLIARPCEWGAEALGDIDDDNAPKFIGEIPDDPQSHLGVNYLYESDGDNFTIYTYLEGPVDGVSPIVLPYTVYCGHKICNQFRQGS